MSDMFNINNIFCLKWTNVNTNGMVNMRLCVDIPQYLHVLIQILPYLIAIVTAELWMHIGHDLHSMLQYSDVVTVVMGKMLCHFQILLLKSSCSVGVRNLVSIR